MIKKIKTNNLILFAIGLGLVGLIASFITLYIAYNISINSAERNIYKFYRDKAELIDSMIELMNENSETEILKFIEQTYNLSTNRPADEYICIVDSNSNLILHTKYPETVGNYAGANQIFEVQKNYCTLNDLVANKKDYIGNYISSSGEKQIAVFKQVHSPNWTIGVHRSKKQLRDEIKSQYEWFIIAFLIISGFFLPLSLGLLFWASKISHLREIQRNKEYQTQLELKNKLLKEAKEKAEESDQLKTAFLQNMSHEIRTPLNSISGFSGMLTKPDLSDEKRKSFVSIIQNNSTQLISIVTDILTISSLETKQEKLTISEVCINELLIELLAMFKQQSQNKNISLYTKQQLTDNQSTVYTDKIKINQILTNLLSNALRFTHEGFIEFGYDVKARLIEFYVKDTGIGIEPVMQDKIFERFRQATEDINTKYGGTGLGLSISKAFIELLGGNIWVQSEANKGSTFYFTIPYNPVFKENETTTPIRQNKNFRTILVAEDEEFNFLLIQELLVDLDVKLIHAKDGKEAVDICKANPEIGLILMDIKMPVMDGHQAAILIKEFRPDLPIIAQSAYALSQEIKKYGDIFDSYITKPLDGDILVNKMNKYLT